MLITRSDDGYFGLRQSLSGVFDKALSSWIDNVPEEHGLTEDGKTVAPFFIAFCSKRTSAPETRSSKRQLVSSGRPTALVVRYLSLPTYLNLSVAISDPASH